MKNIYNFSFTEGATKPENSVDILIYGEENGPNDLTMEMQHAVFDGNKEPSVVRNGFVSKSSIQPKIVKVIKMYYFEDVGEASTFHVYIVPVESGKLFFRFIFNANTRVSIE